jgi:hypothetical protein
MIKISRLKRSSQLNKVNQLIKTSRLKKIVAEWTEISMSDPDIIQKITDSMTYGYPVQINYQGSGWRNIQPYGWNTSKQKSNGDGGNVLLMCYKDSGELRSYRLDKIEDLYIDYDNQVSMTNNPQMNNDQETQIYEDIMNDQSKEDLDMPPIPGDQSNKSEPPGVYDDELSILRNEPEQPVQAPNPNMNNTQQPVEKQPEQPIPEVDNTENTQQETPEEPQNVEEPVNNEQNVEQPIDNNEENIQEQNNEEEENKNE